MWSPPPSPPTPSGHRPWNLRGGLSSFAFGWPTAELAPQLFALTAADTAVHLARGRDRRSRLGLVLAAGTALGLTHLVRQSRQVQVLAEQSLVDSLGEEYADRPGERPTPVDLATPWRKLVNPFSRRNPRVRVDRNLAYTDAGDAGCSTSTGLPAATWSARPVLLQVHGGGWTIGSKDQQGIPLMHRMAERGWVCVAINYRLAPRDAFPAQIVDVKRAIAWVKDHIEEYGGDPSYVVITGGSAGGHLTALAALTPNDPAYQPGFEDADTRVQAAVPFYGVYDFAGATGLKNALLMRDRYLAPRVVQRTWDEDPEVFEQGSPILRITDGRARLLRHPRRARLPGRGRAGPALRRRAARDLEEQRRVRRVPRHPARVRRLPLDPLRARRPGGRALPRVAPGAPLSPADERDLLALARAARGFMPDDEGLALHRLARERLPLGPVLEVGTYCGKSAVYLGAAAREVGGVVFTVDHHRGSEENQAGWEHHDPSLVDPATGRMDTLPFFRRTIDEAGLEDVVVAVVGDPRRSPRTGAPRCRCCSSTAGTARSPRTPTTTAGRRWVMAGGLLAIHDVFPDPADGGRPPYEVYLRALASGAFEEREAVGSLRVLARRSGSPGERVG